MWPIIEVVTAPNGTTLFSIELGGSPEIALCFLDHGVDVHQTYNNGSTMLHLACKGNQWPVAKRLIEEFKLDSKAKTSLGELSAHMSAWGECLDALKYFVEKYGVNIGATNERGEYLLHFAANGGRVECAKYLVEKGVRLDAENIQGLTPYDYSKMSVQNQNMIFAYFKSFESGSVLGLTKSVQRFSFRNTGRVSETY